MKITINIPKNDYVQPTEPRAEVVQTICDRLLNHYMAKEVRWDRDEIYIHKGESDLSSWKYNAGVEGIRIRGVEMDLAFKALVKAGYYIHCGSWTNGMPYYIPSKKPFLRERYELVSSFNEFID